MKNKSTSSPLTPQTFVAGLALRDNNIEFVGDKHTLTVIWLQNGIVKEFKDLPFKIYKKLLNAFLSDKPAVKAFQTYLPNIVDQTRKVELYTYFVYGDLNSTPDVIDGELQPSENFRHTEDCISLKFASKNIDINGVELKHRQIKMIDAWSKGVPDKTIASDILSIAITTYDFHKSKLFKILNVQSKPEAVAMAYKYRVLCA